LHARVISLLISGFITNSVLIVLLDLMNKSIDWAFSFGIPLLLAFYLVLLIVSLIIKKTKQKGVNIIAYILLAIAAAGIFTEGILSLHMEKTLTFHWSLILLVCIVAISAILLFIHFRLKKATDLSKFFHI
ncbi:MAG TPA: hypothetical protein P5167_07730, partial [Bacteroidales bacterium]|nr:hypothetical protein [Bacteroidales bacterium]